MEVKCTMPRPKRQKKVNQENDKKGGEALAATEEHRALGSVSSAAAPSSPFTDCPAARTAAFHEDERQRHAATTQQRTGVAEFGADLGKWTTPQPRARTPPITTNLSCSSLPVADDWRSRSDQQV